MFWKMLQPYLRTFGEKQIQVLVFEDLKRSETSYAQSFLRFVGVTPTVPQVDSDTFKLEAAAPRVKLLATLLRAGAEAARVIGQPILVQKVKESLVPRLAYRRLRPDERPALTETERLRLESHFAADVKSLSSFIGRDLYAEWFGKARSPEIPTLQPVPGS
jgi:hypothetical protein